MGYTVIRWVGRWLEMGMLLSNNSQVNHKKVKCEGVARIKAYFSLRLLKPCTASTSISTNWW
ncbi:hypothetical protein EYF80_025044 [Liparis tanakae]|uniref:Uncharacterized protein n=1 Tax=Liparis tanakae TaxID=230148 RepID=A0A4Z2HFU2_9TELE|nr:hypothetical protein EYF80_025044 [Liparis tanakae]